MKNSLLLASLLALTCVLTAGAVDQEEAHVHYLSLDIESDDAAYYYQAAKGFFLGYQQGFYKNKKTLPETCFSDETLTQFMAIIDFLGHPSANKVTQFFLQSIQVGRNIKSCAIENTISEIYLFCNENECNTSKFF
eukprot:CAMPEP_0202962194 /NCGR_PEP_ID=MMETSP1396-20130829/6291_1 /ASSEMBLY_ACC=CAM_ASM_000872 /TAXON_ID= /ORGANISM="Pseudokeronopsis sp., Strain Brazil" /LENGTH=135 /DNA_ID=CAMNT_0049682595 /DNA_START=15 /DNA_END=422 /DNA_ORIENTATION=+